MRTSSVETHRGKSTQQSNESVKPRKSSTSDRQIFPSVCHGFLHYAETQPNRQIFFYKDGANYKGITWKEYYENVKSISLGLVSLGVDPGDRVCIISNTRLEWSAADMAILGTQGITVPIYASNLPEDMAYIINHCEAHVLFVEDQKQLEKIRSIRQSIPHVEKIVVFSPVADRDLAEDKDVISLAALRELGKRFKNKEVFEENLRSTNSNDIFTICYTSGTTGQPKGVVLRHDSLNSLIEDVESVFGAYGSQDDILLSFLPLSHIFGKVESMMTYHFGWQVYYAESIEKLFTNIGEVRPTLLFAVPRVFEKAYNRIKSAAEEGSPLKVSLFKWAVSVGREYYENIWNHKRPSLQQTLQYQVAKRLVFSKVYQKFGGRLRYCIAGGAPLPLEVAQFMQVVGITILEGYGLTETCAPITLNTPDAHKFGSVGKPLPEVAIKIAEDGEVICKTRKNFAEYFKNPDATSEVLHSGWFHTGDIGVIDSEGFLKITDRKKDLIITSGGKNVAPQKIENLLKTFKYINQVIVVGDKRNYLAALVVLEKDETVKFAKENNILFSEWTELIKHEKVLGLVDDILKKVNSQLPSFETVKRFQILPNELTIDNGEITPSLKIKRKFCTQKYKSVIDEIYGTSEVS